MALYTNLPVYEDTYLLLLQFVKLRANFQRDYRYTLGQQVQEALTDIAVDIFRANKTQRKAAHIAHARERLVEVRMLVRLLNELRQVSVGQFAQLLEQEAKVSKQLAAWEKLARRKEDEKETHHHEGED